MNTSFLYEMLTTASVSGNEIALQKKVLDYMTPVCDEIHTDENGNVISILNPESSCKVLLAGHIDEIGLMICDVTGDGFLCVKNLGGIYRSTYPGHKVRVHTKDGIVYGAVVNNRSLSDKKDLNNSDLLVDIGANSKKEALQYVEIGDTITFDTDYRELKNNLITGRALDDRTGAFVVIEALRLAKEKGCKIGVYSATTVGEESGMRGAYWASSRVQPSMAIAVDVTYATDYPGCGREGDVRLGNGPVLCIAPYINRKMNILLKETAQKLNINLQLETESGMTGTDADKIHYSGKGVPVCLVSIPLRYMHNPDEVGSLDDIKDCIELLSEFLCSISESISLNPFNE
ncbi:MAG: M42 family metallopeptidase [Lachnospiraceae bacterium]|nr:M42 family metallopeptidase [Lachnospiraceae bacterium]